tara:strand:- start:392 stop:670 length:279 start_codon:yes stop_codon:yes gene_type:complete
MKATLKLDNLEATRGGTKWVNLNLKIEFKKGYSEYLNVKIRAGGINIRIMSDHLVSEMKHIINFLDTDTPEIQKFAKDLLKADDKLNETITL